MIVDRSSWGRLRVSGPVSLISPPAVDLMTPRGPYFFLNSGSFG